jgi:D-glycero-D-manno-heptose 1,7-bisphosphate phosphatase
MDQDNQMKGSVRPAVFLDRDGVINRKMVEGHYVTQWSGFEFLTGVTEAIRLMNGSGYLVIVVTNQQCVGKGIVTMEAIEGIHLRMVRSLEENGARIDGIYVCPHLASDGCSCRKPATGLFEMAARDFRRRGISIDMVRSHMIGDSDSDILAGENAGLTTFRVTSNYDPRMCPGGKGLLNAARSITANDQRKRMAM